MAPLCIDRPVKLYDETSRSATSVVLLLPPPIVTLVPLVTAAISLVRTVNVPPVPAMVTDLDPFGE